MENIHVLHFRWVLIFFCVAFSLIELVEVSRHIAEHRVSHGQKKTARIEDGLNEAGVFYLKRQNARFAGEGGE